jgi:thioredoxin 1
MASPHVVEFTQDNWQNEVVAGGGVVLVDFWAPWCGPCRQLTPIVDRLADQFAGKVKVGKVNVDENPNLAVEYDVTTIPRLMVFKGDKKPVRQIVGLTAESELVKLLNGVLAS